MGIKLPQHLFAWSWACGMLKSLSLGVKRIKIWSESGGDAIEPQRETRKAVQMQEEQPPRPHGEKKPWYCLDYWTGSLQIS